VSTVLVTGGYGYIGSHVIKALAEAGLTVDSIDYRQSSNKIRKYVRQDRIRDVSESTTMDRWGSYDHVIHLAGLISVEQSVKYPWLYFKNNILGTKNVIDNLDTNNIIFASTAAAFKPNSPYATSKIAGEQLLRQSKKNFTIFRFFNVAGNNGEFGQIGQATHLIRIAAETAAGKRDYMNIYGTDWDTRDGTTIRDYIHVMDLVDAIIKAVEMPANSEYECLGSGIGYSTKEVIETMKSVSGVNFKTNNANKRPGDPAEVLIPIENEKSHYLYKEMKTLEDMCLSAYKAELK